MGFALLAGCGGVVSSTASSPVNLPHHNPAQPAATFEIIRQGDPCKVFGATTTDTSAQRSTANRSAVTASIDGSSPERASSDQPLAAFVTIDDPAIWAATMCAASRGRGSDLPSPGDLHHGQVPGPARACGAVAGPQQGVHQRDARGAGQPMVRLVAQPRRPYGIRARRSLSRRSGGRGTCAFGAL